MLSRSTACLDQETPSSSLCPSLGLLLENQTRGQSFWRDEHLLKLSWPTNHPTAHLLPRNKPPALITTETAATQRHQLDFFPARQRTAAMILWVDVSLSERTKLQVV